MSKDWKALEHALILYVNAYLAEKLICYCNCNGSYYFYFQSIEEPTNTDTHLTTHEYETTDVVGQTNQEQSTEKGEVSNDNNMPEDISKSDNETTADSTVVLEVTSTTSEVWGCAVWRKNEYTLLDKKTQKVIASNTFLFIKEAYK